MPVRASKSARRRNAAAAASAPASAAPAAPAGTSATTGAGRPVALLRTAKGTRPEFYEDAAIDQLFAIVTALTAEVSVAFEHIDTLERLLQQQGTLASSVIESFQPGAELAEQRARHREELIQRVFAVLESSVQARAR
jgi:alpha-glucuronidase